MQDDIHNIFTSFLYSKSKFTKVFVVLFGYISLCSGTHFGSSSLQGTQSFYGLFSVLKEVKLARVSVGGIGGDVSSFLC